MKLVLYCTKEKPNIVKGLDNDFYISNAWKSEGIDDYKLNGKIVAECDFEVDKLTNCGTSFMIMKYDDLQESYRYTNKIARGSCLDYNVLRRYLGTNNGYAISIKNLNIFNETRELSEFDQVNNCCFEKEIDKDFEGLPIYACVFTNGCRYQSDGHTCDKQFFPLKRIHNMSKVFDNNDYEWKYVISVSPEEMFRIANKEQTVLVRRNVLKEML